MLQVNSISIILKKQNMPQLRQSKQITKYLENSGKWFPTSSLYRNNM